MEHISSLQNSRIKGLLKYQKASFRKESTHFVAEGFREITQAVNNQWKVDELYVHLPSFAKKFPEAQLDYIQAGEKIGISTEVFDKLAYREGSDGLIALVKKKSRQLTEFTPRDQSLVVVLEALEKPGNIGAVLRSCDAAGVSAVILADSVTDSYNPNIIRSSLGSIFSLPVFESTSESTLSWLQHHRISIVSAVVDASMPYDQADMKESTAVIMGSEAYGLSELWRKPPCRPVSIPMYGSVDSLNVSNACTILLFEARRQRRALLKDG